MNGKSSTSRWPAISTKVPPDIKKEISTIAAEAGISQPEVLDQLIWGYLPHMIDAWRRGEPIPPRPWRDLPMPKRPVDPKPTTVETVETSALSEYIASGSFPEDPEPDDAEDEEPPEEMPDADEGSTPVRRKRRG